MEHPEFRLKMREMQKVREVFKSNWYVLKEYWYVLKKNIFGDILPQGGPLPKIMVKNFFLQNISIWVPFERSHQTELKNVFFEII